MNAEQITGTARTLVAGDWEPRAMDESTPTCDKRSAGAGIPETGAARRAYRERIVRPGIGNAQTMKQRAIKRWENGGGYSKRETESSGMTDMNRLAPDAGRSSLKITRANGQST